MPRALFTSKNLIGDSLYVQPALEAWSKEHEGWDIDFLTLNDHIAPLYMGMGIPNLKLIFERGEVVYDFEFEFQVNQAFSLGDKEHIHISTAYGKMLGYEISPNQRVKFIPSGEDDHEKGLILLSMYSNSCASRKKQLPNKMISWAHWWHIVTVLRQLGRVGVLGGPGERVGLQFSEDEYYTGFPLEKVARMLRDAKLLVTIDNGMGHLAASQGTPTILFYPQCLSQSWIVPAGNQKLFVLQMDPTRISVTDASVFVREALKRLWKEG
jgi:glycosyl transferase family 9 (putative heptosyltransferase)